MVFQSARRRIPRLRTSGVMDADNIVPFEAPAPPPRSSSMKNDLVEKAAEIVPDPLVLVNLVSNPILWVNS